LVPNEVDAQDTPRRRVAFKVCDVVFPEPHEVLSQLYGDDVLHGIILDFTDRGKDRQALAVIEVEGKGRCVVVPAERVKDIA
jgi:hypothetical protein